MIRFFVRRVAYTSLIAFMIASGALLLATKSQGDYVAASRGIGANQRTMARERVRLHLDRRPAAVYAAWLAGAVRLDFGTSLLYQRPVGPLVAQRAANTALLALAALIVALGLGLPLGVFTGSRPTGFAASVVRGASLLCLSVPPLIASILLVALAATSGIAPTGGMTSLSSPSAGWLWWLRDLAWHVPVPALALGLPLAATLERVQSQAFADALREPCIAAALARGVPRRRLLWRHAWRLSAKPVSAVVGLIGGAVLSGSFAVELVTAWPGLGRLTYDALGARDIYLAAACASAAAAFLALGILGSDLMLAIVDPRIAMAPRARPAAARP
jgi:peptide/nickel transport system permease protein